MDTIISFRIPKGLAVRARVAAAQQDRSRSDLIRDLITAYLIQYEAEVKERTALNLLEQPLTSFAEENR
jgi:metal-responsive CopG/Arc/MetJ family transcriptional regulator